MLLLDTLVKNTRKDSPAILTTLKVGDPKATLPCFSMHFSTELCKNYCSKLRESSENRSVGFPQVFSITALYEDHFGDEKKTVVL